MIKLGFSAIEDYTAFNQDRTSVGQVGKQDDQGQVRSLRLNVHGDIGKEYTVGYLFAAEYMGFDTDPQDLWNITDLNLAFPICGPQTKLTVGKIKEPFDFEMVGDTPT